MSSRQSDSAIKNFVKHGNRCALLIDRSIQELLKIDLEQPLELTTGGSSIRRATVGGDSRQDKRPPASRKVNTRYKKTIQKLAE